MKKASKLVWALLSLVMAAVMITGCPTGNGSEDDGGYKNPTASSTTLQTYYIKAVDASREGDKWDDIGAAARLHLHLPKGSGFKIQKIFTSNTMSEDVPVDATVWYDFTKGDTEDLYLLGNYGGTIVKPETVSGGLWTIDNSTGVGEDYPGNLGIALDDAAYFGFVMANVSDTSTFDNLQLEFMDAQDVSYTSQSCAFFFGFPVTEEEEEEEEELLLTEWTPAYVTLNDNVETIILHANNGLVEIQKIMVNTTQSVDGADVVLDFTQEAPDVNVYWSNITALATDAGTATGRFVFSTTDYVRHDAFGTPASSGDKKVWIFVIRTTSADKTDLGDTRVQFGPDDANKGVVKFSEMEF